MKDSGNCLGNKVFVSNLSIKIEGHNYLDKKKPKQTCCMECQPHDSFWKKIFFLKHHLRNIKSIISDFDSKNIRNSCSRKCSLPPNNTKLKSNALCCGPWGRSEQKRHLLMISTASPSLEGSVATGRSYTWQTQADPPPPYNPGIEV